MSAEKFLWMFHWDYGRVGNVNGLFVATEQQIKNLIGQEVFFGEILGKQGEICGTINEKDLNKIDISSQSIEEVSVVLGSTWSGYNPMYYVNEEDECEEEL